MANVLIERLWRSLKFECVYLSHGIHSNHAALLSKRIRSTSNQGNN